MNYERPDPDDIAYIPGSKAVRNGVYLLQFLYVIRIIRQVKINSLFSDSFNIRVIGVILLAS